MAANRRRPLAQPPGQWGRKRGRPPESKSNMWVKREERKREEEMEGKGTTGKEGQMLRNHRRERGMRRTRQKKRGERRYGCEKERTEDG